MNTTGPTRLMYRPVAVIFAIALLVLLTTSCFESETTVEYDISGNTGSVGMDYRIDAQLLTVGMYDQLGETWSFPVNREEFERVESLSPEVSLASYSSKETDGFYDIKAKFNFTDLGALRLILGESVTIDDDGFSLVIAEGLKSIASSEQLEYLTANPQSLVITTKISVPGAELTLDGYSGNDAVITEDSISVTLDASDLISFDGQVVISVILN